MILQRMRIIPRFHAYQEGKYTIHATVCSLHHINSTHKIVGISTLSRADHGAAQSREYQCTRVLLPQVLSRGKITSY